ncbi:MAG: phospho-sugar mutase, partial [Bacteroidales bacterium]
NGYKLYWSDGAQVLPPYDQEIIRRVDRITEPQQVKWSGGEKNITLLDGEIDRAYLDQLSKLILNKRGGGESISIVYTPLHGAGVEMVPRFLKRAGFRELHIVEEQTTLDGTFATLQYPNPEEPTALKMALELAHKVDADLVLATDPDCDRVGAASKERGGGYRIFNGNEIATLLIYYILERLQHQGRLNKGNKRGYLVKTIVTTDLIRSLGAYYNVEVIEVLTGFKYIAQIVAQLEGKKEFIAGAEESHGFNVGEAVRDKDGVIASALLAEVAEWAKESRKTLSELLNGLYLKFGLYREELFSIPLMGIEAKERSTVLLEQLRATPPLSIAGEKTLLIHDYLAQESVDLLSDLRYSIELPKSNVLQYITSQNSIITVRASGTEPKLKLYIGVKESLRSIEQIEMVEKVALERIERLSTYFINHFRR